MEGIRGTMASRSLAALVIVAVASVTLAAQAPTYKVPRTPDGQPDLQGFWSNATYTPLERPDSVTKEFYTPAEAAAAEKAAAARESAETEPGTVADVHYDFTQFGLDRSQATLARTCARRSSSIPRTGSCRRLPPKARGFLRRAPRKPSGWVGRWDSAQSNQLDDRCLIMAGPGPPMMDAAYNSNYHIVQAPGYVMILTEMIHDVRIIPLDGRPQPPESVRQWMGVSRGRWEGDTLVVVTTNFNGKNPLRGSTENMTVTERLRRVADDTIEYNFTIEDKCMWKRPWSVEMP